MPDEAVRGVLDAVRDMQAELPETEQRIIAKLDRHRRAIRWAIAALAAAALAIGIGGGFAIRHVDETARESDRAACESANQVRTGLLDFVDSILAPPPTPLGPGATPEQQAIFDQRSARRAEFVAQAQSAFALLDCG